LLIGIISFEVRLHWKVERAYIYITLSKLMV
jgi:hypothetical protein